MNDDKLSPSEREAYDALPRERQASRALEARVLGALRREGLVRSPRGAVTPWWSWRLVPAMAAGLVLFAGGMLVGVRAAPTLTAARVTPEAASAARLEQSGAHYLDALAAFSRSNDTTQSPERVAARRVAARTLREAAQEVARLDPSDPLAARINGNEGTTAQVASNEATHIVWY